MQLHHRRSSLPNKAHCYTCADAPPHQVKEAHCYTCADVEHELGQFDQLDNDLVKQYTQTDDKAGKVSESLHDKLYWLQSGQGQPLS